MCNRDLFSAMICIKSIDTLNYSWCNKVEIYIEYNCNYSITNRDLENWIDFIPCHNLGVGRPLLFIYFEIRNNNFDLALFQWFERERTTID